jgi:hypothetical protein
MTSKASTVARVQKVAEPGSVATRKLESKIIETTYRGRISAEMAAQVRADLEPLLRETRGINWLIDATDVTGMAAAPREDTIGVVELFKRCEGHRIAAVISSSPVRMVASALVFATGLPLRMFHDRDTALAYLRETPGRG